jgi:hypothetical protein
VLPQILLESQLHLFRFWFNDSLQDGLHYQNDLYYRVRTVRADQRTRLYHLACRLAKRHAGIVVSAADDRYSLWINLRHQKLALKSLERGAGLLTSPFV